MTQLYAVPHDGSFDGDSSFFPGRYSSVVYTPGMSIADIATGWYDLTVKEWELTDQTELEVHRRVADSIVGAWIVDESWLSAVEKACALIEGGGDSEAYAQNYILKILTSQLAVYSIGEDAHNG